MKCTNHPETEAEGMCTYCGKPFCHECLVEIKGRLYCKGDLEHVIDEAKQSAAGQPTIRINNSNQSANTNVNSGFYAGPRKSKTTALILCILGFFGIAGIHRMYIGKVGTGILYLLTGGLCGVGTVVDLILILTGGLRDYYGMPLV